MGTSGVLNFEFPGFGLATCLGFCNEAITAYTRNRKPAMVDGERTMVAHNLRG